MYDASRHFSDRLKGILEEAAFAYYYGILFSFLFSMALIFKRRKKFSAATRLSLLVLGSCFLFWLGEHMIIYPDRKYRFPLEPLMILGGSFFLQWWMDEFKWRFPGVKRG